MEEKQELSKWLTGVEIAAGIGAVVLGFCASVCGVSMEAQHLTQSSDLHAIQATLHQTGPLATEMVVAGVTVAGMGYVSILNGVQRILHRPA